MGNKKEDSNDKATENADEDSSSEEEELPPRDPSMTDGEHDRLYLCFDLLHNNRELSAQDKDDMRKLLPKSAEQFARKYIEDRQKGWEEMEKIQVKVEEEAEDT